MIGKHKFASGIADSANAALVLASDWNADVLLGYILTNRTGGTLNAGDVVAIDSANNDSVVLADTVSARRPYLVFVSAVPSSATHTPATSVADTVQGIFLPTGVASVVKVAGATTRGNYLRKSATTKALEDTGIAGSATPPGDALGVALQGTGGAGTIPALFWGHGQPTAVEVLNRDVTTADVVNTTTETTVYSFTVPGGTLGTTRALRLTTIGDLLNNVGSGADLTIRVKWGATTVFTRTFTVAALINVRQQGNLDVFLSAHNATNAQVARSTMIFHATTNNPVGTYIAVSHEEHAVHNALTEDSTTDKVLSVTYQWSGADANRSARVLAAQLELL